MSSFRLAFAQPLVLLGLLALPLLIPVARRGADVVVRGRRIAATVLRAFMLGLVIVALAGPSIVRQSNRLAVVFLVDASDSVNAEGRAAARDFIRRSLAQLPRGDTAGIVVFGDNALVERSIGADSELRDLLSKPATGHTDLAGAVRLGLALFPEGYARRLVLISDGQENKGDLTAAANAAAASGAEISTVTLRQPIGDEVLVGEVRAPARAREGERVDLQVTVESTREQLAKLRLFADGNLVGERDVQLRAGRNGFQFTVGQVASGFHTYRVQVAAAVDTFGQNNVGSAYTDVKGRPKVLVLEGGPDAAANVAAALRANGFVVDTIAANRAPATLAEWVPYDAVILVDAPAESLAARLPVVQSYVRDLGRGLVVIGGERAYGPGGYTGTALEETLPVRMDLRNGVVNPPVSLVFVLDKSGSMGGTGGAGVTKLDLAKEAAFRAIKLMQPQDEVGIVAFDDAAYWVADRKPLRDQPDITNKLGAIRLGGGTNIYAGLDEAVRSQLQSGGKTRHIILVTDGNSANQFDALIRQMQDNKITLTVVGVGGDVAPYLPQLAQAGGGRYYFAADPSQLPEIFVNETRLALRSYFIEGEIVPRFGAASPITEGLNGVPRLRGYVGTTAKPTASTALLSPEGDPLLAQWQYGLGRVVAWTSDAKGQWAAEWLPWSEFARFWSRAVAWTIAATPQDLQVSARFDGDRALVTVDALEPGGGYRNGLAVAGTVVGPDGGRREVTLRQTAPGRYETDLGPLAEGSHLLAVVARDGEGKPVAATTGGLVVPYSPEYALPRGDRAALTRARELTGGVELTDPAQTFAHTLPPVRQLREFWMPLVLIAILLLPFDIALRRLMIGRRELRKALAWASAARRPTPAEAAGAGRAPVAQTVGSLLAARERMQARFESRSAPPSGGAPVAPNGASAEPAPTAATPGGEARAAQAVAPPPAPQVRITTPPKAPPPATPPAPAPAAPKTPASDGTLGQLLRAKEQARRKRLP